MRARATSSPPLDEELYQQLRQAQRGLAEAIEALGAGTSSVALEHRAISRELLEGLRDTLIGTTERLNRLCTDVFRLPATPASSRDTPERPVAASGSWGWRPLAGGAGPPAPGDHR